jgi:predicted TIM-barrel fold metal-dependent hydrolase
MEFEIIDFHTHPFLSPLTNICNHPDVFNMDTDYTLSLMKELGVSKICGSVAFVGEYGSSWWDKIKHNNDEALKLKEIYGDFYVPGFHVHPDYIRESMEEIERMHAMGIDLIGELVPYLDGWGSFTNKNFYEILKLAEEYEMTLSLHSGEVPEQGMLAEAFPRLKVVSAHPGEYHDFMRHVEWMNKCDNFYLDLSGYGIFRHGMLRAGIDKCGVEKFIFGSDYPTCNPAMYIGAVTLDPSIKDYEREMILAGNAKRMLGI